MRTHENLRACCMPSVTSSRLDRKSQTRRLNLSRRSTNKLKSAIAAHAKVFNGKSEEEQQALKSAAQLATLELGPGEVARSCPSCGADGTLFGDKVKEFKEKYEDGELLMDVQYMASGFKCVSCGLVLKGIEQVTHAGLDTHFVETVSTSLHELYSPDFLFEYNNM